MRALAASSAAPWSLVALMYTPRPFAPSVMRTEAAREASDPKIVLRAVVRWGLGESAEAVLQLLCYLRQRDKVAVGVGEVEVGVLHSRGGLGRLRHEPREHRLQRGTGVAPLDAGVVERRESADRVVQVEACVHGAVGRPRLRAWPRDVDGRGRGVRAAGEGGGYDVHLIAGELERVQRVRGDLGSRRERRTACGGELECALQCAGLDRGGAQAALGELLHGVGGLVSRERRRCAQVEGELVQLRHFLLRRAQGGSRDVHRLGELLLQVDRRRDDAADPGDDGQRGPRRPSMPSPNLLPNRRPARLPDRSASFSLAPSACFTPGAILLVSGRIGR